MKARHTRRHTGGFHAYDILEKAKQQRQKQTDQCQVLGVESGGGETNFKVSRDISEVTNVLYPDYTGGYMTIMLHTHGSKLIKLSP